MKLAFSILVWLASGQSCSFQGQPEVEIDQARVVGRRDAKTHSYLGIPFAQPPVGALRLKAPVPLTLNGTVIAQKYGRGCIQRGYIDDSDPVFSEDCLTLNVATPASGISNAPVVVFVYGGSFTSGQAGDPRYDIRRFVAANPNVVFVSFNYRLGFLGFAASQELQVEQSLNLGLLDQKLAFEWVRKNIAKFGGDPNNVTAMGNSAGALSLNAHLFSQDGNQKLFDRVIQLSGGPLFTYGTIASSQSEYDKIAAAAGCSTDVLKCLRSLSTKDLFSYSFGYNASMVVDGTYLTKQPLKALLQDKSFSKIPQLLYNDRDEGSAFALGGGALTAAGAAKFTRGLLMQFNDEQYQQIMSLYAPASYPQGPFDSASDLWGDLVFQCPTQIMSRVLSQSGVTVYSWINNRVPSIKYSLPVKLGVFHTAELPLIFDDQTYLQIDEIELGSLFRQAIVDFAFGRQPLSPQWRLYGNGNRFDVAANQTVPDSARSEKCNRLLQTYLQV